MNILIVEDDKSVARFLQQALTEAGYTTQVVEDGETALHLAVSIAFDLILLDVMLPRKDGFALCKELRAASVTTPILIITARDTLEDKIEGLDSGADDYIVKPCQIGELLARVRALLRRGTSSPPVLRVADLTLDPATRKVCRQGKTIHLSMTEFALLEYLMRNAGRVVTRLMILEHVWQYDFEGNDNVLDVYISYLRSKIDRGFARPLIHTVRGVGYRLEG
ncbi:response regulator with CheY-like receiver domain and winged-helix DNA-binding domain [Chthonomonas calidirosea]|uniref:Response regulators consisting of a CheY-like receiver domain and a winged-helix DNA-binding domain n=1 Tax=Chthonomonas calidirosea (strain DSM 23976 / ICMP 18418 / T49) TaxID=1303518 RepID=S0ETT5_CHTCT|nr:response regulator transcription factor [Chthonomonas calidirosea]CCW34986.1 Response regulators consisting of a CheY-like receiver domain and a winged-helix DNA-binding domain [Chthonomonas calidirosea T49]CEK20999.1 response regulator with CheY-like receiver domain and winged-helix DNA-binding domain [Chthonomonas calidirosea]